MFGLKMITVTLLLGVLLLHTAVPTRGYNFYNIFKARSGRQDRQPVANDGRYPKMLGMPKQDMDFYRLISHLDNVGRR